MNRGRSHKSSEYDSGVHTDEPGRIPHMHIRDSDTRKKLTLVYMMSVHNASEL